MAEWGHSGNSKEISFFWAVGLNSSLKILSESCGKQMCCYLGYVVPFIEHRQSRFTIILSKIFFLFSFFFCHTGSMKTFLGQGSNLCHTAATRATVVRIQEPSPTRPSENSRFTIVLNAARIFFFFFFWLHPWHVEVAGIGTEPISQQWPTTVTMPNP